MTSEGGIFLAFQWACGKICEIGQNRPRNGQKSDFLAIFGHFEALKTPQRCQLKTKLVKLFMGHNLKAFRAKKIRPGWQGGSIEVRIPLRDFGAPGTSFVSDTGLPSLTSVMSRLQGDISLVIRISTIIETFGHVLGISWAYIVHILRPWFLLQGGDFVSV